MRNAILILTLNLTFLSCKPPVVFDSPYPLDAEDLIVIPQTFRGDFMCESDSAVVIIKKDEITLHKSHYFETKKSYLLEREDCRIEDENLFVTGRNECIPIKQLNDTIVQGTVTEIDTLFKVQKGSNIRMHEGNLIINQELQKDQWAISILTPQEQGDLVYKALTSKSKIKSIGRITTLSDITTKKDKKPRYIIKPTMKEFDELMEDPKVFIECEYLTAIHLDSILSHEQ